MDYKMDADDLKFAEIKNKLVRDVKWKLKKIYYSLPYPDPMRFGLADEVDGVVCTVDMILNDIKEHIAAKIQAKKDGI